MPTEMLCHIVAKIYMLYIVLTCSEFSDGVIVCMYCFKWPACASDSFVSFVIKPVVTGSWGGRAVYIVGTV